MSNHICSNKEYKLSVFENMENGQSFVTIHVGHDEIKIPIDAFRYMVGCWNKVGWDSEWDKLSVTDRCFPKEQ